MIGPEISQTNRSLMSSSFSFNSFRFFVIIHLSVQLISCDMTKARILQINVSLPFI